MKLYDDQGRLVVITSAGAGGDMYKATYDIDDNGIVDNSEKLEGSTKAQVQDHSPNAHAASHQNGGADEVNVGGLSGLLADDQHILDAEAVSAMGAKADGNPLHHDRATEWGAAEHTAIGDGAPHHAKYTNAEAKAAAVQAGAITNGVTKAPTHDAVYDVKVTADAAQTAAEVNAKILTHKNIAAAHHAKTVDASELSAGELPLARLKASIKTAALTFIIDGGGSAITTGQKGHLEIPFACTINWATLLADQSGSIVIDIWKDIYANFPPTNADSITASAPPTISSAQKSQDSTLAGWTTSIAAGDILAFNVDSCTTITRVTLSLKVTKS